MYLSPFSLGKYFFPLVQVSLVLFKIWSKFHSLFFLLSNHPRVQSALQGRCICRQCFQIDRDSSKWSALGSYRSGLINLWPDFCILLWFPMFCLFQHFVGLTNKLLGATVRFRLVSFNPVLVIRIVTCFFKYDYLSLPVIVIRSQLRVKKNAGCTVEYYSKANISSCFPPYRYFCHRFFYNLI